MPNPSPSAATIRCGRPLSIDEDTREVATRRNVLLGLWATDVVGLAPSAREAHAWSVHFADFAAPGFEDVIAKLVRDFTEAGIPMPERRIRFRLRETELRATFQLSAMPQRGRPRRGATGG